MAMFKFAAKVLSFQDDDAASALAKLAQSGDMPEFVQDAAVPDSKELDVVQDYDFALVYYNLKGEKMRKYLLIDPGNIWLSAKYFLDSRADWPKIAQGIAVRSILSRAEKHGISRYPIFDRMREVKKSLESEGLWRKLPGQNVYNETLYHREQENQKVLSDQESRSGSAAKTPVDRPEDFNQTKTAAANLAKTAGRKFALNTGDDHWVDRPMYDITTPELVKQACSYFENHHAIMPLRGKRKFARAVLGRASELGIPVPGQIALYGSVNVDTRMAYETMSKRARMCGNEHKKLAAGILHNMPNMSADELIICIEAFDKKAFDGNAGRFGLPDPVLSAMGTGGDEVVLYDTGAKKLTLRGLKGIVKEKVQKLREVFDARIVDSLQAAPEKAFKALPTPFKKVLTGLASA